MRWWERAVIAAWWIACLEAAAVLALLGVRGVEDVLRGRAKRLAVEADSARGMTSSLDREEQRLMQPTIAAPTVSRWVT